MVGGLYSLWILDDNDHGVTAKEQFRYVSLSILRPHLLSLTFLGHLSPHLKDGLEDHVHVPIERLDISEQLAIVAAIDQHLAIGLDRLSEQGQRTLVKYLLIRRMLLLLFTASTLLCIDHLDFFCSMSL